MPAVPPFPDDRLADRQSGIGDATAISAPAPATASAPAPRTIRLATGTLEVAVESATYPLDALCDFAARDNPKRGFLVVSRVLGRHLAAAPATMRASVRDLAARLPRDMPGPIMVVGLAETAVCLGQMVHAALRAASGREDVFFLHSTRQRLDRPLLCRFEEPHSHASAHLVYRPDIAGFAPPRTLILVDDEVSTGTTVRNLATGLVAAWPVVEQIAVATLTDWSGDAGWVEAMPRPTRVAALLAGRLRWTPGPASGCPERSVAAADALGRAGRLDLGRTGLRTPVDMLPDGPLPHVGGPLRIVGTGEFTYLPFRLAERLERQGHDVVVQATSRSPARPGAAMTRRIRFRDNYGTAVPNYLYNADPDDGRATWLCHETGADSIDRDLTDALGARLVGWNR